QEQAQRRAQGGRVQSAVETLQSQQTDRTDEREQCAGEYQRGNHQRCPVRQGRECVHSITSPRIRNLANAEVLAKPSTAMTRQAATYSRLPVRIPILSNNNMAST